MSAKWLIGMVMIYVILVVVSGISQGTYFGGTGAETIWNGIIGWQMIDFSSVSAGFSGVLEQTGVILWGVVELLTWKFSFFTGTWMIIRVLLAAISFGIVINLIQQIKIPFAG